MQNIGEGVLELPQSWFNSSINIFTAEPPGKPGPSLTVNRDRLQPELTFGDYANEQLRKLQAQLKNFKIEEQREIEISGRPARMFEFTWTTEDGGRMHQMLLTVHGPASIVNLVASHGQPMDSVLRQQMQAILTSFHLLTDEKPPQNRE